jgi:hypothetical protein
MNCATVKEGTYCSFMTAAGCGYNGGRCHQVVEECEGCERIQSFDTGDYCTSYANPAVKWESGRCNFATNVKVEKAGEIKINPLKASKRSMGR